MISSGDVVLRLGCATLVGLAIGLDREMRGVPAGLRTHALVGLSAAAITLSALLLHDTLDADGRTRSDPLRVIQGLAQAIGFIAAGLIFVARDQVKNVTSAAGVWLTATLGIAAGAGQYFLLGVTTALGLFVLVFVRLSERYLPRPSDADFD
ncbi:MgtC/SapB family protein [Sphingomonas sp. A2-49]|jgi:putative Mg2+ transporter-C (MgtC) family protein|uniref:MgtC/SapB family protein n=1 Tax=Sphingomonas sp. A2-49 TaxID=1391375 RepID=UPI0021CE6AA7|nr:MgtC/SapB family protein [Sphingomonas sp. A2-49]MCU6453345.1 MgtC/SapB family protein [Sphingomonas sp. A2-49]